MGWILYLKVGAVVVLVAISSYFYINYNRMQTKIATQALVIEQQAKTIETYAKFAEIEVDTPKFREESKKAVESGDPQKIIDFFEKMRKLSEGVEE